MNIFTVIGEEGKCCKIDRMIYEEKTGKDRIYYRENGKHYAICPACNNPINIVNIYDNERYEIGTRRQAPHGRHHDKDLPGLANYNKDAYNSCPLANPKAFGLTTKRKNKEDCNEIIEIIDNNKELLLKHIRDITGIYFSNSLFEKLLSYFMNAEGYYYEYINKFNLPYSFLYIQRKINLFNQWITYNSKGTEIKDSIEKKSKSYEVIDNKVSKKEGATYAELNLALFDHRIKEDGKQTIQLRLYEDIKGNEDSVIILKKTIEIDMGSFISKIK